MKRCRFGLVLVVLCGLCAAVKSDSCSDDAPYKAIVRTYTDADTVFRATRNAAIENLPAYPGVYLKTLLAIYNQLDYFKALILGNATVANDCLGLGNGINELYQLAGFNVTDYFYAPANATGEDLYHSVIDTYGAALTKIVLLGTEDANVAYPTKYQSYIIRAGAASTALQLAAHSNYSTPACLAAAHDLGVALGQYFTIYTDNSTDCSPTIAVQPPASVSTVAPVVLTTTTVAYYTTRSPSTTVVTTSAPTAMTGSPASVTAAPTTSTMAPVTQSAKY